MILWAGREVGGNFQRHLDHSVWVARQEGDDLVSDVAQPLLVQFSSRGRLTPPPAHSVRSAPPVAPPGAGAAPALPIPPAVQEPASCRPVASARCSVSFVRFGSPAEPRSDLEASQGVVPRHAPRAASRQPVRRGRVLNASNGGHYWPLRLRSACQSFRRILSPHRRRLPTRSPRPR